MYSVWWTAWTSWRLLNDSAFLAVYIFTLGDRWECARGEKCETQVEGRCTLGNIHTLPLTLGQRSSHTTHRPLPLVCLPPLPTAPAHQSAPPLLFPCCIISFSSFLFADIAQDFHSPFNMCNLILFVNWKTFSALSGAVFRNCYLFRI